MPKGRSRRIKEGLDNRRKWEELLDRHCEVEGLKKINNTDPSGHPIVCPCCQRMLYLNDSNLDWLEKCCGGWGNIESVDAYGHYVVIVLKVGGLFDKHHLMGSGIYAYKFEINRRLFGREFNNEDIPILNDMEGRLKLVVPDSGDAKRFKNVVQNCIDIDIR